MGWFSKGSNSYAKGTNVPDGKGGYEWKGTIGHGAIKEKKTGRTTEYLFGCSSSNEKHGHVVERDGDVKYVRWPK